MYFELICHVSILSNITPNIGLLTVLMPLLLSVENLGKKVSNLSMFKLRLKEVDLSRFAILLLQFYFDLLEKKCFFLFELFVIILDFCPIQEIR